MNIQGSIALVTGGNRGLGKAFVQALLDAGARQVYVGTRQPFKSTDPRLQPVKLDITNASDIAAAAQACQDITILINNAGIAYGGPLLATASLEHARAEITKSRPEDIAKRAIEAIAAGQEEVLTDERSQEVKKALAADPESLNRQMQELWDSGKGPF